MFSARSWAHDRKVRSLPWANKFWHAQLSSSAGVCFFKIGCGANLLAYTLDSRWESEVLTMGWENLICPSELRRLDRCFWKRVWALMFSAKSWPQDRTTRSLPWAKIFCHVQTSPGAGCRFFKNACWESSNGKAPTGMHGCNDSKIFSSSCRRVSHFLKQSSWKKLERFYFWRNATAATIQKYSIPAAGGSRIVFKEKILII